MTPGDGPSSRAAFPNGPGYIPAPLPPDEDQRLAALHALQILDTPPEERFDRVTRLARRVLGVPIVLITLVDANRQCFKSCQGLSAIETPRDVSFCAHAILQDAPLVVPDTHADPRFAGNPFVLGDPQIRFYAGQPLHGPDGYLLGTLCVVDRRPRQLSADDLAALRDLASLAEDELGAVELNQALRAERTARAELERVSRVKSDLVSIVSHEFRTALTGIMGFSEMLQEPGITQEDVREFASRIGVEAKRLNRMITELLDLDRMEAGRMPLRHEDVALHALLRDAVERFHPILARHPIALALSPEEPVVFADRDKLMQVAMNLISNAVKYSPDGGPIEIGTRVAGDHVEVWVRDRGLGIPPDQLEAVFERYRRVESGAARDIPGTGLGLPIVRQIVALHGGAAWAESTPGAGSTIRFTLPLAAPRAER